MSILESTLDSALLVERRLGREVAMEKELRARLEGVVRGPIKEVGWVDTPEVLSLEPAAIRTLASQLVAENLFPVRVQRRFLDGRHFLRVETGKL